ncbi:putative histamine N-methyltransferase A [Apostichopus japonicus]|uniref:Putative histamine N-methyltransferase A n=1 Tax=Stichopus japonicus TaxID=307972 RepID=A0A2G8KBB0_STIJA|nr:putative histamine N-methyltransferase A [Apostichopus japonicus]
MDCNMITQLLKKFPSIANTVLEPAADHIEEYKKLLESKGFGSDVDFNWRQQTWDEYYKECKQVNQIKKFHFISAIHSLYYVEDLESTILDLINCLEEGGVLLMIAVSDDSGFWRLWKRFPMFADDLYRQINSGDIRRILDTHQIGYKAITQESRVDITCCYEDGNQDGVLLTDFLNHVVNLRECSSQSFVDEVLSYMRGEDCTVQNGDQLLFNNDWQAIIVTN